jgi:CHAD domain-containing protein
MRTLIHPRSLTRRPVRALLAQWPLALVDDVEGIHQSRVASRRLRELVPVLARPSDLRDAVALRRGFRTVTRLLGRSRELDVALGTLQAIEGRRPGLAEAVAAVRAHVVHERAQAGREVRGQVGHIDVKELAAGTLALAGRSESPTATRACARRVAARLSRRAAELELAVLRAGLMFASGPLHRVRIALKKFRYSLEVAERTGRFRLGMTLQRLKGMQDLLGELHDLQVLAGLARDVMTQSPAARRGEIESLVTCIDDEIRGLHSRYVTERDTVVVLLARAAKVRRTLVALPPPNLPPPPAAAIRTPPRKRTRTTEDR